MSETIWRATDNDGRCWYYGEKPDWSEHQFYSQDGRVLEYYGTEKPPPGECWEMTVTRKGDIDTDGEPIGWKIVGIGKDGSVLCEKPNGQRRRYSFGDGANGKPSGEAWERLVAAAGAYTKEYGNQRMRVSEEARELMDAYAAYEAAQSAEPSGQQAMIAELQEQIRKLKVESATQTDAMVQAISEREDRIGQLIGEVQRLTAKLERPEMPECVRELVDAVCLEFPGFFAKKIAAVEAHYAPPFRIDKPGWYLADDGLEWRVAEICGNTAWGRNACDWYGFCTDPKASRPKQLTKYLRPLEE